MRKVVPPPHESLKELLFYKDGALYWTDEALEANKKRKPGPIGCFNKTNGYLFTQYRHPDYDYQRFIYGISSLVYWVVKGEWPPMLDHIDGNRLNNDIDNLRPATFSENMRNRRSSTSSNCPYVGVHRRKRGYRLTISIEGKQYTKDGYKTAEAAALARDVLANLFYGDFASYNFLDKPGLVVGGITI
ncbi:TPA: HNH endonuclease [Salmonella enterica subsp. enterica serovar Virchow]|uniref:HNH nuclease domain-containing protein n=1 Tax=Kluyvera genomosp. 3 TaxID=2774055 RepID=A0A6G9RIX6_9ENTR|nr:HNH endonuclease [Kluyvera genomosp. 3]EAZ1106998.1 hypothetical protein [Salmonella enterica]ECC3449544.1 hypothetical protein [Salmonella enterica subsp. enterica serovar Javiana]ECH9478883.1 hypothetical protein [Salmonella enterica subsp. enterica]EDW6387258.1 hypothetical protein [Salmonella enterica subsp. enterica serovar Java]EBP4807955.1 hypothetical protein [Salmonella enterica]